MTKFDKMNKDVEPPKDSLRPDQCWKFSKSGWRRTKIMDEQQKEEQHKRLSEQGKNGRQSVKTAKIISEKTQSDVQQLFEEMRNISKLLQKQEDEKQEKKQKEEEEKKLKQEEEEKKLKEEEEKQKLAEVLKLEEKQKLAEVLKLEEKEQAPTKKKTGNPLLSKYQ